MPLVRGFPSWKNINSVDSSSSSGQIDNMTGLQWYGEGLYPGVYSDLTNKEAFELSNPGTGILYSGRYRYVQVDSSATAANVKTGTVGYMRLGSTVKTVAVLTQGTGQTTGTYQVAASGGGGTGAIIQVVVTAANAVTATVLQGGIGYTSVPTFTLATGGTPGTVAVQLDTTPSVVTSFDQVGSTAIAVRPVVFLNSITPGNYGFIQELGTATVLGNSTFTTAAAVGALIQPKASGAGTVDVPTSTTAVLSTSIGLAIDLPVAGNLFKIQLQYVPVVQD